ncbi:MAG: SDR family oxidoreductase [Polyangiaceae bacterium]|nr:SDR family oxidoreductase [Myxococcales bacterium]MCB9588375.1 SDR family oxidoreductase [Polyangiaceae bacterium]
MAQPPLDGVILITGASSGIGSELARQLASRAKALVLLARRTERLEQLAKELRSERPKLNVFVQSCDLLDRSATDAALERIEREVGPIDVLINNAGLGDISMFDLSSWEKNQRMLDLNVTALTYLSHRLVPGMVERGRGGVLQVSSGFGLNFMPGFATYVGTKHYVTGFTECLRLEVASQGVVVSQLCPGPVRTEFEEVAADFETPKLPDFVSISAEQCAKAAVAGFKRNKAIIIPGALMKLTSTMSGLTPRFILRLLYGPAAKRMRVMQKAALEQPSAQTKGETPSKISALN